LKCRPLLFPVWEVRSLPAKSTNCNLLNITLSYRTLDKIYAVDAKLIPVKERLVILIKNDKFYLLRYRNTEDGFARFNKAFNHIIKTLKFKDAE